MIEILADRLKKMRKLRKMTQDALAKKANTTKSTISNYENQHSTPSNDMLVDLAEALGTTTDYLLGRSDNYDHSKKSELDKIKEKIATEFPDEDLQFDDLDSLTAHDLREIYNYIKFRVNQRNE